MPTTQTSTGGKKSAPRKSSSSKSTSKKATASAARTKDAVALLKADHREVERLFSQFEKAKGEAQKQQLAEQICMELRIHAQIEEEIFYHTAREFLNDDEIVNEALVEHQSAKDLISQIEGMPASDEMFDAKVSVLKEMVEHHVQEEEKTMMPQLQKSEMDLKGIGEQLMARKEALMSEMGGLRRSMQ